MTTAVGVFEVLADPTRRHIVATLRRGERSVNDLVTEVGISQPGVSRQLRILHDAGFVQVRAEQTRRYYALRPEPFRELQAWMQDYRHMLEGRMDRLAELVEDRPGPEPPARRRKPR